MARILVVGAGDVGGTLAAELARQGHSVWGLRRNPGQTDDAIRWMQADVCDPETLLDMPPDLDLMIYTVAAKVFSREGYHQSYVEGLTNVLNALSGAPLRHAFFVSSSSVYHQMDGEWVDEESATHPTSFAGRELLAAEQQLTEAAVPSTVVRFTGIYGPGRTLMIEQARHGGHCDPEPPVWTNRIHRDDCVGVLRLLVDRALAGEALDPVYLASDDEPAPLFEVLEWMKDRIAEVDPDHDMPEVTRRANRRCSNQRLKSLGYEFRYPNYREGYDVILTEMGYS